ncbi:hypothetical protein PVAG01_09086 [Phlyctema vagabunda]|uniref:Zn(2)-C6 fungal-type domain-containing protein n=1 Tax=Phlyctema vagabunda TaxID=108571 RepID=A0ABR4P6D4_9HELO
MAFSDTSFLYNNVTGIDSFTITQPFLGAPLEFSPALGTRELDELVDSYVLGFAPWHEKLSDVTIDFYKYAAVDLSTGSLVRTYNIFPVPHATSPVLDFTLPMFTPSPNSDYSSSFTSQTPPATAPKARSSRVTKKSSKATKTTSTTRLPGFSIMTRDGVDVTTSAGRGTKTKEQREHAHLMRIMKACDACKRKKIRCDPSHRRSETEFASPALTTATSSLSSNSSLESSPSTTGQYGAFLANSPQSSQSSQFSTPSFGVSNTMDDFILFPNTPPPLASSPPHPSVSLPGGQLAAHFDTPGLLRSPQRQKDSVNGWTVLNNQDSNLQTISPQLLSSPQLVIEHSNSQAPLVNAQQGESSEGSPRSLSGERQRTTRLGSPAVPFNNVQGDEARDSLKALTSDQRTDSGDIHTRIRRRGRPQADVISTSATLTSQLNEQPDASAHLSRNQVLPSSGTSMTHTRDRLQPANVSDLSSTVTIGARLEISDVAVNKPRGRPAVPADIPNRAAGGERQRLEAPETSSLVQSPSISGQRHDVLIVKSSLTRSQKAGLSSTARQSRSKPGVLVASPILPLTAQDSDSPIRLTQLEGTSAVNNLDSSARSQRPDFANSSASLVKGSQNVLAEELRSALSKGFKLELSSDRPVSWKNANTNMKKSSSKHEARYPPSPLRTLSCRPTTGQDIYQLAVLFDVVSRFARAWACTSDSTMPRGTNQRTSNYQGTLSVRDLRTKFAPSGSKPCLIGMNTQFVGSCATDSLGSIVTSSCNRFSSQFRPLVC